MEVIYWNDNAGLNQPLAATVGFFDGVHRGHRFLIGELNALAREAGLLSAVITFADHPQKVLSDTYNPPLLTGAKEKAALLVGLGVDYGIILPFTPQLADKTAQEFIEEFLCKQLHIKILLVGHDHRFGKGRTDGFTDYQRYGEACGMQVVQASKYGENKQYNSTTIRSKLAEGDVKGAAELLSHNYSIEGTVIEGDKIGREIGFPTANIRPGNPDKLIPKAGVYAVKATVRGTTYPAMLYIGLRPTLPNSGEKRLEVHLFHFNQNIYGETITIEFIDFIREDIHFNNLDELREQLEKDKTKAMAVIA
jgi:riboflavin kinase/FMN adenylyltransferase